MIMKLEFTPKIGEKLSPEYGSIPFTYINTNFRETVPIWGIKIED
jgi:hypothetical protein